LKGLTIAKPQFICIIALTMKLQAMPRTKDITRNQLLAELRIPAVFYGKQQESTMISLETTVFEKAYAEAGESTIISLNDGTEDHDVLVRDVQYHPVTDQIMHVDFYVIEQGKKLNVTVPLNFVGEAPGEKVGILMQPMHEIEVEVLPRDMPQHIDVDITGLVELNDKITVGDLVLPSGVTVMAEAGEAVALIAAEKEEELDEPVEAIDMDAVGDSEEKGKGEEEGGEETEK
jgi:large subunit ribosomal protein L25